MPVREFASVADVATTTPKSLAESGRGAPVELPAGVRYALSLAAFESGPTDIPQRRFEMTVTVVDTYGRFAFAEPVFANAELVDDSGRRFACQSGTRPADGSAPVTEKGEPSVANYTLLFELPTNYRFRSVSRVTVHWRLRLASGDAIPISSQFRS